MKEINSAMNSKDLSMAMDSGSNYKFYRGTESPTIPRSSGNLSYTNTFSANEGQLIPCWTQHTLFSSDYKCRVSSVVRVVNPPVVPLMSRQRIYFNSFWASYSQLWKDAQIFFTKSKSSTTSPRKLIPYIALSSWKRGDLADYLGFCFDSKKDTYVRVPALKFMLYLRIYRDYFANQRFWSSELDRLIAEGDSDAQLIKNFVFPDDDSEFRIGTSAWNALTQSCIDKLFMSVQYRNWTDDYFTKAQLTPLYSDTIPSVPLLATFSSGHIEMNGEHEKLGGDKKNVSTLFDHRGTRVLGLDSSSSDFSISEFIDSFNNTAEIKLDNTSVTGLTIDAIRKCACDTAILEKMAKVNGSYKEFARVIFGETPRSSMDYTPLYIGGTYQNIEFSTVVNSSGYGVQGQLSGLGMSSGNSDIGTFHSDDFGISMTICCIMPDTYYCQGWNKTDLYMTSDDFFYPERAGLGMQPITLSEIYKTGDPINDDKVFGYQNRFDELRYRPNEVHGKVADKESESFFPYIQTRYFQSAPTLSPSFVSTQGTIPKDWLSVTEEIPYLVQVSNICEATHPVPYRAKENNLGF